MVSESDWHAGPTAALCAESRGWLRGRGGGSGSPTVSRLLPWSRDREWSRDDHPAATKRVGNLQLLGDSPWCTQHSAQGYRLGGLSWAARALADGTMVPTLRRVWLAWGDVPGCWIDPSIMKKQIVWEPSTCSTSRYRKAGGQCFPRMTIQQNHPGNFSKIDSWAPCSKILLQQIWAGTQKLVFKLPGNSGYQLCYVVLSRSVMSDSLQPHGL